MMHRTRTTLVAAILLLSHAPILAAQNSEWPEPYRYGGSTVSTGGYMERNFEQVLNGCGLTASRWGLDPRFGSFRRKTTVPRSLRELLATELTTPVEEQWNESLARVFAYIYRPSERTSRPGFDDNRLLKLELVADAATMVPAGISNAVYEHSCGTMVRQTMSANGGFPLAPAMIEVALDAEITNKNNQRLLLAIGTFRSPLDALLSGNPRERNYARFLLWDWYERNRNDVGAELYYLQHLNGIAGVFAKRTNASTDLQGKADVSLSLAVAGAKSSTSTTFEQQTRFTIDQYSTAAYNHATDATRRRDINDYRRVPTLDAIINELRYSVVPQGFGPMDGLTLTREGTHHYRHYVDNMPQGLCSLSVWTAKGPTGVVLDSMAPATDPQNERCAFRVRYEPSASVFIMSQVPITLDYTLITRSSRVSPIEIAVPTLRLGVSTSPDLHLHPNHTGIPTIVPTQTPAGLSHSVTWTIPLLIHDEGDPVRWTSAVDPGSTMHVVCKDEGDTKIPLAVQVTSNVPQLNGDHILTLTISRTVGPAENRDFGVGAVEMSCKLTGGLTFTMAQPNAPVRRVTKELPADVMIQYPRRKQTALAPAPGSS